jgi:hypothetical protein
MESIEEVDDLKFRCEEIFNEGLKKLGQSLRRIRSLKSIFLDFTRYWAQVMRIDDKHY